jgi:hypothetical protein
MLPHRTKSILPAHDPVIAALDGEMRDRIGREWLRRAEVELTAATFTAQLVRGLLLDGAAPEVVELAARAVVDEVGHGRLCHEVAERYLGRPAPAPRSRPADEPVYGDCPPQLSRLLALVMHSCINETLATVCLRDSMRRCESPTAKAATRRLLRDDLNHARLGWAHLASPFVDAEARYHVGRALPTLLRLGQDGWINEPRAPFDDPAHGVLGPAGFPALMKTALSELVLPGFDHVGVDTRAGREWFTRHVVDP